MNETSGDGAPVQIRNLLPSDAGQAAELSAELGYPVELNQIRMRIEALGGRNDHRLIAACVAGQVVGWIDVSISHRLTSGTYGEIAGLIVSQDHQGRGIGKKLVSAAETWIQQQGVTKVLVRCQVARQEAHEFYRRMNFSRTKTQEVFVKNL